MLRRRTVGAAFLALATASTLALSHSPAEADFSPQPKDVVSTGSDIIQNSFNFLADGYADLPGYNTAGNRYRFVNFDSSGDAQGRSAFSDPRLLPTITGDGTLGTTAGQKYIKQSDLRLLNPTISLRAGQPLVVRPSGGGAGGRDAIINDKVTGGIGDWIDVGRTPNTLDTVGATNYQQLAQDSLGTKLIRVQVATDRQLIATSTTTNAPTNLTAGQILNIYNGTYKLWGDIPGWGTGSVPGSDAADAAKTIIPLLLPTDAGMWNTFVSTVTKQNPGETISLRANTNSIQVQQNDPTAITALPEAQRENAIVPFPRGRFKTLQTGYYTQTKEDTGTLASPKTNLYNTDTGHRTAAGADGIQLLNAGSTTDSNVATAPYGGNFPYNAVIRESDLTGPNAVPWQPGSTLNWVEALFYNPDPDGPKPFVRTPAGEALLLAAGVVPDYHVFGTDNAELPLD